MKFDKDKFFILLKERKSLKKESKSFWDSDNAKTEEWIQSLNLLDDQIFWQSRETYCQMLNLFVRKKLVFMNFLMDFLVFEVQT